MKQNDKIFIAGHRGMVGSALVRLLTEEGYEHLLCKTKSELNLLDQESVRKFMMDETPDVVVLSAARVGGINANMKYPANFLYENIQIQNNIIHFANEAGVKKVIFLGSSCIYPKECPQPMNESYLLTGPLEPTNEGYAIAKIAGLKMLEFYHQQYGLNHCSLMPCNLYGPNDSFDLEHSHVLSALVKRFTDAKNSNSQSIELWGSGIARREFMHVDDLVRAVLYFSQMKTTVPFFNVGWGEDVSIKELAMIIAEKVEYKGELIWNTTKPNGMLRKCMDVTKMRNFGFEPKITLSEGIDQMINIYNQKLTAQ